MKVAAPKYLGEDFSSAPSGHRFGLYFAGWDHQWEKPDNSLKGFEKVMAMPPVAEKMAESLSVRQLQLADESMLLLMAKSISPFATGLGNEHPMENGFSFLNPYGIPYLPGSGIKGVMRSAACELVKGMDGDHPEWSESIIDQLFGSGGDESGSRGALSFWDVIPRLTNNQMGVEIMNPHYGSYYQGKETPNDNSSPVPIFFLTVPPGSGFTFHVQCQENYLEGELVENWRNLIEQLFSYAFDWVGFGAKTSVGYGAMELDTARQQQLEVFKEEMELAKMSEDQRSLQLLQQALEDARQRGENTAGGPLSSQLTEILGKADEWPQDSKNLLADLAEQIYGFVGWGPKKKKPQKKARLAKLRGEE